MVSGPLALRWCVWAGRGDLGPDMELPSHSKQLLLQLNQQRTQGFLCDVIVMVENAVFRAHKNVLAASSVYFKSLVLHDNLISLDTDMVSSAVFQQILDFIYTGRLLPGEPPAEPNFSTLLTAASYLQLPELAALCRRKLKRAGKPFGSGRGGAGLGRPPRSQRLSTASVIQTRYPGLVDGRKGAHVSQELSQAKGSDDELFLGSLSQEGAHGLGRPVCPGSGEAGLGGEVVPASPEARKKVRRVLMVMVLLAGANCVLDPLVYYFSAEGFRNTLRGLSAPLRGKTLAAKGAQEALAEPLTETAHASALTTASQGQLQPSYPRSSFTPSHEDSSF